MGLLYSLLTFLLLSSASGEVPYSSLEKAFESNSAKNIVALGKDKILIDVLGDEGVYSKSQATLVLKNFFSKNPASSFTYIHKGKGSSEGSFAIGTFKSGSKDYRVTVQFKKINGTFKIESLAIEK